MSATCPTLSHPSWF